MTNNVELIYLIFYILNSKAIEVIIILIIVLGTSKILMRI